MTESDLLSQLAARIASLMEKSFTGEVSVDIKLTGGGVRSVEVAVRERLALQQPAAPGQRFR